MRAQIAGNGILGEEISKFSPVRMSQDLFLPKISFARTLLGGMDHRPRNRGHFVKSPLYFLVARKCAFFTNYKTKGFFGVLRFFKVKLRERRQKRKQN